MLLLIPPLISIGQDTTFHQLYHKLTSGLPYPPPPSTPRQPTSSSSLILVSTVFRPTITAALKMLSSPASFLVLLTHLLVLARAGGEENIGGWFPARHLSTDIKAKAASFLRGRVDTPPPSSIQVVCNTDRSYDPTIAEPPNSVLFASITITGLPNAEANVHANQLKKAVEDACFAGNLATYELRGESETNGVAVDLKIKGSIRIGEPGVAPPFCVDDALRKFTGDPNLPFCADSGF